jgi:hypothetical protein
MTNGGEGDAYSGTDELDKKSTVAPRYMGCAAGGCPGQCTMFSVRLTLFGTVWTETTTVGIDKIN